MQLFSKSNPKPDSKQEYLDIAAALRPELEKIDGFISIERFASLYNEGKVLSLSYWRDEKAVQNWRKNAQHREAQNKGRNSLFKNYRIRVAEIIRDYGPDDRTQAPESVD